MLFMNKSGASQYWNSIQIQEANTPVTSLEVSTDGGSSWIPLERKSESNFCEWHVILDYFFYQEASFYGCGDMIRPINPEASLSKILISYRHVHPVQPQDGKGLGARGDIRVTCLSGKKFVSKNLDLATPEEPQPGSGNC